MVVTEIGDPRLSAMFGETGGNTSGVRPTVRLPSSALSPLALAVIVLAFGALMFVVLNEKRTRQAQPSVKLHPDSAAAAWREPPQLFIPSAPTPVRQEPAQAQQRAAANPVAALAPFDAPRPAPMPPAYMPHPLASIVPMPTMAPMPQPLGSASAPLVVDNSASPGAAAPQSGSAGMGVASEMPARLRASPLANGSTTIVQGTLIQAVLETGLDSTRPGFARALVSRDVRSFDGTNVLIPRGSKLVGEYRSDVAQGQKRAVIIWTRLIRPDGMTVGLDSPTVDPLGRGGVAASVNTHFFARLGNAFLQSTIGIGSALVSRRSAAPVLVLPGNGEASGSQFAAAKDYVPVLTVRAGKSISVFVAHDLDFSSASPAR